MSTEQPKCIKCSGGISEAVIELYRKLKEKRGQPPSMPKVCGACLWDIINEEPKP